MKSYEIWEEVSVETYHYVGLFSLLEDAVEFCQRQETRCVVCKATSLIDERKVIYKNY